ncbi:hypothetical protein [Yoonia vestfoldensis]|uniref:hypothetical protein n=1 Tax=Yoonia vestfoldensis TaxID=245188 RepID=UPI0003A9FA11|nr:hypothetical protein [Yoonia vestfoldensis]
MVMFPDGRATSARAYAVVRQEWARQHKNQTGRIASVVRELQNGPLISVIVPVFDPEC